MSKFVTADSIKGTFNADAGELGTGVYFLRHIILDVQRCIKNGGFEKSQVMEILINWFRVGQYMRNPQYARFNYVIFLRDAPPPRNGWKPSAALLESLQRLERYPISAGVDSHAVYFTEAENAMATFIHAYRKVLEQTDPATLTYFIGQLRSMGQRGRI
jgi:hypothetical protein